VNLLSSAVSFIFYVMAVNTLKFLVLALLAVFHGTAAAQTQSRPPETQGQKLIYRDSDGKIISNNEFVDIRMANFHYPDATIVRQLEDGTTEFRLQKIPQEGMRAPNFKVTLEGGESVSLADLSGKVVVLNFWFIGCPVCRAMKPRLNEFMKLFKGRDDVVFLALTADRAAEVRQYLKKEPFDYLQAADAGDAIGLFNIGGYPKNVVISGTGEIIYWRSTIKAWDKFESVVRSALAQ